MSNSNTNLQTQSSNALHNAIMEAGSKDRPPMLAPVIIFSELRNQEIHLTAKPNSETHLPNIRDQLNAETEAVSDHSNRIDNVSTPQLCLSRMHVKCVKAMKGFNKNELVRNPCVTLLLINECLVLTSTTTRMAKKIYKPTNNNLRTSSNTSRANQDNSPRINRGTGYDNQRAVNVAGARENVDDESEEQELEATLMNSWGATDSRVNSNSVDNSVLIFDDDPMHKGSKGELEQRTYKEECDSGNNRDKSFGSSSSSSLDSEVSTCSKECLKSYETLKEHYDNLTKDFNKYQLNVGAYKACLESVEARLDVYKKNELRKKFEKAEKERDDLKLTLEKFENSSKNLSKLLEIQVSDKFKTGVRYDSQVVDSQVFNSQVNDKYKTCEGYHAIPPTYTRNFMPPKFDLVLADEDEYVFSKSVTSVPNVATSKVKTSESKPKFVGEQIIENWISDSEDENETEFKSKQRKPSFAKVEFIKSNEHVKIPRESVDKKMVEKPVWNNASMVNHQNSQRLTHPHPKGNFVPKAVLMKSGYKTLNTARQNSSKAALSVNTARPINIAYPRPTVNCARPSSNVFNRAHSHVRRPFNKFTTDKNSNFKEKVNTVKGNITTIRPKAVVSDNKGHEANAVKASACWVWRPKQNVLDHVSRHNGASMNFKRFDYGNPQLELKEKGVINSRCSRHMAGNKSYLSNYEEIDGGFVAFGGSTKGGKITGKGKIRTGKLDFEDVYFVKELKFNLFSVSQMCDKKNSVLFTDTECVVLSPDFKLLDENQVLLRVPRKNNMYSVDLKNVVPSGGLTCLFAKATLDESNLWHRRLGHINFKTMNKLVRGNLVRGLPSKFFENDHTCVACQKGKQHKASYYGTASVTYDFSRFSWVFFLATKDETSGILKAFITGIENQINHRVEFKNKEMNKFCEKKGIKREFSVARTPQQNGVAKRKNRTLATRTMLADSKLPTTFWAEAVNTACYVQNRVLVIKPHNKTPYELFLGRKPSLSFTRPFGCPVTILNSLDHLGKFDGKADEGFFVGYSVNSKTFRVFNSRTRIVEENLHITFLVNKPTITGSGPEWLFDIDTLTKSMNYKPVFTGNQTIGNVGTKESIDAGQAEKKTEEKKDAEDQDDEDSEVPNTEEPRVNQEKDENVNNTNIINTVSSTVNTASIMDNAVDENTVYGCANDPNMPNLEEIDNSEDDEGVGAEGKIEEEFYVYQPPGFEDPKFPDRVYKRGTIDKTLFIKKVKGDILLVRVYVDDIIFGSTKKSLCTEFEKLMHKKFQMTSIASTPIETSKPLMKDENAEDVDVHLYRSTIGSLMYLTSLRPDIMFDVYRKSTTGGCQFLRSRLFSWQCKKQTVVTNSTTEAEYVCQNPESPSLHHD
ncbi:putative ribonuclease H-like domain-containing protein [Tanacetum coccineum]